MDRTLTPTPLTAEAFAPYGEVLTLRDTPDKMINDGFCGRHNDLAGLDFVDGRAGISLFDAKPRSLPYRFDLVERHPEGSQAFVPMHRTPWLVIVAPDKGDRPGSPQAFIAQGQGINLSRGIWHGVLTPLEDGLFAVVDRIGGGANLEEWRFDTPWTVAAT